MLMNEYQKRTQETAIYPGQGTIDGLAYSVIGMVGEAGEVANRFKKVLRDENGFLIQLISAQAVKDLESELGDTLWYIARIAEELGTNLETIAQNNLQKLAKRALAGKIRDGGNDR